MKHGFIPALGTPLDAEGNVIAESLTKQIDMQIEAGAVGLLCMGSMGNEAFLRAETYTKVAQVAVKAAAGRVPVFVGAMDTSILRVKERIAPLEELDIAGFVFTAPFYSAPKREHMMNFFRGVASLTKHKILLYDLPSVAQSKITYDMVLELLETVPNLGGIKSADTVMLRKLRLNPAVPKDFVMAYSGLDMFDIAYKGSIPNCLDGMLSCTPYNTAKLFAAMDAGDYDTAAGCLDNIVDLRDCFIRHDVMPSFTAAMNLLGMEGNYAMDYMSPVSAEGAEEVRREMIRIGELAE